MIKLVPNILTFMRLLLTLFFLVLIFCIPKQVRQNCSLFMDSLFVLFVVTALTDIVDGIIARRYNASSKFGRMLDPLVDKVLICGAFICFAIIGEPQLFDLSQISHAILLWTVAGIITLREIVITIIRHIAEGRGINFAATASGKIKMLVQSFAIGTIIIKIGHFPNAVSAHWFTLVVLIAAAAITIISAMQAVRRANAQ